MSLSLIILTVLILLVMFGAGQRVLDRMKLSDKWALIVMVAIVIGILIPPIAIGSHFTFSIGGFLIPFGICIYLMIRAGWSFDLLRAFLGIILTTVAIVGLNYLLPSDTPQEIVVPNTLVYGAVAGLIAYFLGRSRRNAFICSVIGVSLASVVEFLISVIFFSTKTQIGLGVAGAFDTIILSTLIAVGLAELIGKTAESIVGKEKKTFNLNSGEFEKSEKKKTAKSSKNIEKGVK